MMPRGSSVPSAPVHIAGDRGGRLWSGREDSNLRPLPPERKAPSRTRWHLAASPLGEMLSGGACSRGVPGSGFTVSLQPLSTPLPGHDRLGRGG